jgi:hypothetical protein
MTFKTPAPKTFRTLYCTQCTLLWRIPRMSPIGPSRKPRPRAVAAAFGGHTFLAGCKLARLFMTHSGWPRRFEWRVWSQEFIAQKEPDWRATFNGVARTVSIASDLWRLRDCGPAMNARSTRRGVKHRPMTTSGKQNKVAPQ